MNENEREHAMVRTSGKTPTGAGRALFRASLVASALSVALMVGNYRVPALVYVLVWEGRTPFMPDGAPLVAIGAWLLVAALALLALVLSWAMGAYIIAHYERKAVFLWLLPATVAAVWLLSRQLEVVVTGP